MASFRIEGVRVQLRAFVIAAFTMLSATAANAQDDARRLAAMLDKPTAVQKVPPKSDADPVGELTCTYYADLMVLETSTNTPAPGDAAIAPIPAGTSRLPCGAVHRADEIMLKTEGFSFIGRKGQFLLFSATDPNGAVPFMLINAGTGRVIYTDGTPADRGFQLITIEDSTLHLRYIRGFNASCSIMQNAPECWSKLVAEGKVPRSMAQSVPSPQVCEASYGAEKAPADDPSIVTYDVDMTVDATGRTQVLSRGTVGCEPVP